jgi:hypothetical protein
MEEAAMSPVKQTATYTGPILESRPAFSVSDAKRSQETDGCRFLTYAVKDKSNAGSQAQAVVRPQISRAESPGS